MVTVGREPWERFSTTRKNAYARIGDLENISIDTLAEINLTIGSDDDLIDITDPAAVFFTSSFVDADIDNKISGTLFDIDVTTSTMTAGGSIFNSLDSRAHDGVGADDIFGITITKSGDFPQGTLDSNYTGVASIIAIDEIGSGGGADAGDFAAFKADLTGATINGGAADLFGFWSNSTGVTDTSSQEIADIKVTAGATSRALSIDAGTTDHTGSDIIFINADINSASCNVINATIDIGTLLSGLEIVKGCYFDINEVVANANTSGIVAYDTTMTGFATAASDLVGYRATFDGSKTGGDTTTGLSIVATGLTLNNAGEIFDGVSVNTTGLVDTSSSRLTAVNLILGASTTGITIDAGTTDHTAGSIITADVDANAAAVTFINATINVATGALTGTDAVKGTYFDMTPFAADANGTGLIGHDVIMTAVSTSRSDLTGFNIVFDGLRDTDDAIRGLYVNGNALELDSTNATFAGVDINISALTNTDSAECYGIYVNVDATADCGIYSTDGVTQTTLSDGTNAISVAGPCVLTGAVSAITTLGTTSTVTVVPGTDVAALVVTGTNIATAHVFDLNGLALTTGSVMDIADITTKTSGCIFNGSMSTSVLDANTLLDDFSISCAHDDVAGDTLRGIRRTWSGDVPGSQAADLAVIEGVYSGTVGASGAAATVYAVKGDVSGATLTAGTHAAGYFADTNQNVTICNDDSHLNSTTSMIVNMPVPTIGTDILTSIGAANTEAHWIPFGKRGVNGMTVTEFFIDLTDLSSVADDGDVIGDTGEVAGATLGQYTIEVMGTVIAIEVTCLEAPVAGDPDIDLYSHATGTLKIADDASGGTQLIAAGGNWTNGMVKGATAMPTIDHYFYLTSGAAAAGDYSAGKFIIRIYGQ